MGEDAGAESTGLSRQSWEVILVTSPILIAACGTASGGRGTQRLEVVHQDGYGDAPACPT